MPVNYAKYWLPTEEDGLTPKIEELKKRLENAEPEEPLYTHREDNFSITNMQFKGDRAVISFNLKFEGHTLSVEVPVTPKKEFLRMIDQINEALGRNLENQAREYTADDRGRISIGSEHANEDVQVIILDG